jgi:hypothetical protein
MNYRFFPAFYYSCILRMSLFVLLKEGVLFCREKLIVAFFGVARRGERQPLYAFSREKRTTLEDLCSLTFNLNSSSCTGG